MRSTAVEIFKGNQMNTRFIKGNTGFCLLITTILFTVVSTTTAADEVLTVYKNPGCGCCSAWADRMKEAGFSVSVTERSAQNVDKWQVGIQAEHQSCHTAVSESGHVFEGHIPASIIRRFLDEQPADAKGLSVPGMPAGSPGMESGNRRDPYDVLLLKTNGTVEVFAHIDGTGK
jgi:hypothetical protein